VSILPQQKAASRFGPSIRDAMATDEHTLIPAQRRRGRNLEAPNVQELERRVVLDPEFRYAAPE
jgi:hypothetical protein